MIVLAESSVFVRPDAVRALEKSVSCGLCDIAVATGSEAMPWTLPVPLDGSLAQQAPIVAAVPLAADAGEPDAAMWLGVELGCGVWVCAAGDAEVPLELQAAAARPTPSATVATPISLGFIAIFSAPST